MGFSMEKRLGRKMKDSGIKMKDSGIKMKDSGRKMKDSGRKMKDSGRKMNIHIHYFTGRLCGNEYCCPCFKGNT